MEEPSPLGTSANGVHSDRRAEAWGAFMTPSVIRCAPIAEREMAKVVWAPGISTVSGALSKINKKSPHAGDQKMLLATHRKAATTSPDCSRLYLRGIESVTRSTPVSSDETLARTRFGAIGRAVQLRKKNLSLVATDAFIVYNVVDSL